VHLKARAGRLLACSARAFGTRAGSGSEFGRPDGEGKRAGARLPPSAPKVQGITLELSPRQVRGVLREATGADGLRELLVEQIDDLKTAVATALGDPELHTHPVSVSSLKLLGVFCAFAPRGTIRGINEVAEEQQMNDSSVYRYAQTLVHIGLLERTHGRKYRIPPHDGVSSTQS
jgi:hypothetical protein